jgi:hypothetical protein
LAGDIAEKKLIQPLLMKYGCLVGEKHQQGPRNIIYVAGEDVVALIDDSFRNVPAI